MTKPGVGSRLGRAFRCLLFLALAGPVALSAQQPSGADSAAAPAAAPGDVSSLDSIMAAVYDVISGPKGRPRDWDRFRSLFIPGARLIPTGVGPDGTARFRVLGVDDYVRLSSPYLEKEGFYEREISRTVERYGTIAQVFSTYESRHSPDDAEPFQRGINSFQLFYDGQRWWVVTIYWEPERPDNPIPERFGG